MLRAVNRSAVYGQVARWLIHDLRNPSQALTLITELMQDAPGPGDEPPEHTIRDATRHLVRSLEFLDRVLRVPPRPGEPTPVSVRDQIEFLGALHRVHRTQVTLDLSRALVPGLPAVRAVEDQLEHALLNLLMNALEACAGQQDGRIAVVVTASDGKVALEVEDNGPGIPKRVRDRLFEPFVSTRTDRPLAGLGLAVARDLLVSAGGTLELDDSLRQGSRFIVTLRAWTSPP